MEIHQKIHDLGLDGDIQRTDRFIADDELRLDSESSSNTDPLALAAAELMGKAAGKGGIEAHQFEEFGDSFRSVGSGHFWEMDFQGFCKNSADSQSWIQRVVRILKYHLNLFAIGSKFRSAKRSDGFALVGDRAVGGVDQTDDNSPQGGFAGAAFPDKAKSGSLFNFQ